MSLTEEQLDSIDRWAACDLREREGREVQELVDEVRRLRRSCQVCGSSDRTLDASVTCSTCVANLREQLVAMAAARDEACDLAAQTLRSDNHDLTPRGRSLVVRVAELRKVGAS